MEIVALYPSHALSGRNPTLFNVVVQYADMDMLRALALTSQSMYEAIQQSRLGHLPVVVLEAPILKEQQQVVYNGADPVPADTFRLPLNNIVATPLTEKSSSTSPPSKTRHRAPAFPDSHVFDAWQQRSVVRNNYDHNLNIPDYARNLMARAQSVELVVYRRRLGTRISSFFTNNAHHLKYGQSATFDGCTSCAESHKSASATTQYKPHLACSPTLHSQHCNTDDGHVHVNGDDSTAPSPHDDCIFSKHCSHQHSEGDGTQLRRLRHHMFPYRPGLYRREHHLQVFPDVRPPSLQLKFLHRTTDTGSENGAASFNTGTKRRNCAKRKRHTRDALYQDGHFSIAASRDNTSIFRPRLQNLPLVEQQAPTTSLNIRIVDCMSFGVEDWRNAIPGCTIQPLQTWTIHDDTSVPHHRHRPSDFAIDIHGCDFTQPTAPFASRPKVNYDEDKHNNIGCHFPHLTSLVLQYTRLDEANRCGSDELDFHYDVCSDSPLRLSHFFVDGYVHLPHLQHFGVVGTLLDYEQYAMIAFHNARTSSLNINPGPQRRSYGATMTWINYLDHVWGELELYDTLPSSTSVDAGSLEHGDTVTKPTIHPEDDGEQDFPKREPPRQPHNENESIQQAQTEEPKPKLRPRRKYNFSIDFADSCLESCCPHKTHILTQRASANTWADGNVTPASISPHEDFSQFNQHLATCAAVHNALSNIYRIDRTGCKNGHKMSLAGLLTQLLHFSGGQIEKTDVVTTAAIAVLAQRTLKYLELRCHYCSHANPGSTIFPGASPGDCTATHLPLSANALLGITDSLQDGVDEDALARVCNRQPDEQMYMRLRELLHIPPHAVLRL